MLIETDHDLEDPDVIREFERLVQGYDSKLKHRQLLDVEVMSVIVKEQRKVK
jgi:hypothetical protein